MAGSIVQTLEPIYDEGKKRDKFKLTMAWTTSTGGGDVSGISTDDGSFYTRTITEILKGKEIVGGKVIPGDETPTDAFDVVVNDENSVDLFGGAFGNCSSGSTTTSYPYDGTVYGSKIMTGALTPAVSNAGNSKTGSVVLFFE